MPSGSRKRKSAKKKQEKVAPPPSSTQGDEDLKHREIEEGIEKSTEDVKSGDVQVEKDGGFQVGGESKTGDGFDEKKVDSSSSGSSSDSDDGSLEVEKKVMIVENAPVVELTETDISISDGSIEVTHTTPVTKLDDPAVECVSEAGEGNVSLLNENVPVDSGASADNSITPNVVELGQKENEEANLSSLVENVRLPEVAKEEPTPEDKGEKIDSPLEISEVLARDNGKYGNIDVAATSGATESAVNKNEEKLTLSYNAPKVDATEAAEHNQAYVTAVVRPDQSTSWKSCCGLFEAFTGTSR